MALLGYASGSPPPLRSGAVFSVAYHTVIDSDFQIDVGRFLADFHAFIDFWSNESRIFLS